MSTRTSTSHSAGPADHPADHVPAPPSDHPHPHTQNEGGPHSSGEGQDEGVCTARRTIRGTVCGFLFVKGFWRSETNAILALFFSYICKFIIFFFCTVTHSFGHILIFFGLKERENIFGFLRDIPLYHCP